MPTYLIRTSRLEQETYTHILKLEGSLKEKKEKIGLIYTDFIINPSPELEIKKRKDISKEDIVEPKTKKTIGRIELYQNNYALKVFFEKKEVSSFSLDEEYKEDEIAIPYKKISKAMLLAKAEYKHLEESGITHAYFLDEKSSLFQVFCFERNNNLSGLVYPKELKNEGESKKISKDEIKINDASPAFKGLALVLVQRIINQEYIFDFLRR